MTSVNIDEMMKVIRRLKQKILIVMKQRDAAIEEARIANESRDAAIEEARIANKSRDAAIEEARKCRIANKYRDVATEKANMEIKNSLIDLETLLAEDQVEETVEVDSEEKTEVESEEETVEVDSEEETVEVVEKEYDGVTYYLEIETNDLYNNEMELVGLWNVENNKPILLW